MHTDTCSLCQVSCQSYFVPIILVHKHTSIQLTNVLIGGEYLQVTEEISHEESCHLFIASTLFLKRNWCNVIN